MQRIDSYHFAQKSIIKMLHPLATSPSSLNCYHAKCQTLPLLLANWCYGQVSQSLFMLNSPARKTFFVAQFSYTPLTKESLFCYQREPLFFKSGKSDIFCSKKFVMSLFRTIFAFENGREVANLAFVFTECLHSAFALGSLWVRSPFASGSEEK